MKRLVLNFVCYSMLIWLCACNPLCIDYYNEPLSDVCIYSPNSDLVVSWYDEKYCHDEDDNQQYFTYTPLKYTFEKSDTTIHNVRIPGCTMYYYLQYEDVKLNYVPVRNDLYITPIDKDAFYYVFYPSIFRKVTSVMPFKEAVYVFDDMNTGGGRYFFNELENPDKSYRIEEVLDSLTVDNVAQPKVFKLRGDQFIYGEVVRYLKK